MVVEVLDVVAESDEPLVEVLVEIVVVVVTVGRSEVVDDDMPSVADVEESVVVLTIIVVVLTGTETVSVVVLSPETMTLVDVENIVLTDDSDLL